MYANKRVKVRQSLSRRQFLRYAALIGGSTLAVGCAPQAAPPAVAPAATAPSASQPATAAPALAAPALSKGTTITIWHFFGQDNYQKWYKWIADEFHKTHPDVTVNIEPPTFDLITKAKAAIAAGTGIGDVYAMLPSVFGVESWKNGLLADLTPYYTKDQEWQSWTDLWPIVPPGNYRWPATTDGAIYSSNESLGPSFVWYWKDMLEQLKVEFPATIDDLLALVPRVKKDLPDLQGLMSAGFLESWHCDYWYYCLESKYDFKGEIARKCVNGDLKWSTQAPIRQGLDLWTKLHKGGIFDPGVMQENYDPDSKVLLKDRKVAMFYSSGPWMSGYIKPEEVSKMGAAYFPKVNKSDPDTFTSNNDMGHVIWKLSQQQKDQAFVDLRVELIKFMDSPESQKMLFSLGIMPVYSKATVDQPIDTEDKRLLKQQIDLVAKARDYGVDNNTYYPKMTDALDSGMIDMALGKKTADDVLKALDAAQAEDLGKK